MSFNLTAQLNRYAKNYPDEIETVKRFTALLTIDEPFLRSGRPGHFTGSAFILNQTETHILLVKHRKLGIWLQPGGHADGNENLYDVAVREMQEETGVSPLSGSHEILDLDIHDIPSHGSEAAHQHYDVRFLLRADSAAPLIISDESTDLKWVLISDIEDYSKEESLLRMLRKTVMRGSPG